MSAGTRLGIGLILGALALGVLGDALFQGQALGANVFAWTVAFTAVLACLAWLGRVPWHQGRRWMIAPLLVFAALFLWRDSPLLTGANLFALTAALAVGALRRPTVRLQVAGVFDYLAGLIATACAALFGPFAVLEQGIAWDDVRRSARSGSLFAVARGVVVATPLLVLFGGLFAAGDRVFASYLEAGLPSFPGTLIRVGLVLAWSWFSVGLLRDLLTAREERRVLPAAAIADKAPRVALGATEVLVALALLDLLFLAFVAVQFRYLFGGAHLVETRAHLTYAAYARHGFFELVVASGLALPVLLLADWTLRRGNRRHELIFRGLAGALIALLFVVIAAALQRMRLYEREYGLTELRLYATGLILWLAAVFAWLAATVLRGRRRYFAVGVLVWGFAATIALNAINPDALIARTNLGRPRADLHYLTSLGDDAVPTLIERLPTLAGPARRELAGALLRKTADQPDLRSWTLSRHNARALLARSRPALRAVAAGP